MTPPVVTVVTPSFNQSAFVEHTIRSVLEQDYAALEYLVVDGGSTDGSVEIIRRHSQRIAWWTSEPDAGQGEALRKGMYRARGAYVGWLNSDDVYLPGAVSAAVKVLQACTDVGLVYANGLKIDASNRVIGWPSYRQYSLLDLLCFHMIHQPTVFIRKAVLDQVGGLDSTYHYLLDHELWVRIAATTDILFVDAYWAAARDHADAKNSRQRAEFGREAHRLVEVWKSMPGTAELRMRHARVIEASALCFDAHYVVESGRERYALKNFFAAALLAPSVVRRYWRHVGLAVLSLVGLGWARAVVTMLRRRYRRRPLAAETFSNAVLREERLR